MSRSEKLTVTVVTQRAGVSRTAFYRNYDSMEQLVAELCDELRQSPAEMADVCLRVLGG